MAPPRISNSKLKPWKETPAIEDPEEEGARRAVEDGNDVPPEEGNEVPPDDDVPADGGRDADEVPPDSFVDIDDIPPDSFVDIEEIPADSDVVYSDKSDRSREAVRPLEAMSTKSYLRLR